MSAGATEAQTVADYAQMAVPPQILDRGELVHVLIPAGASSCTLDLERYAPQPNRLRGDVTLFDAASFLRYVNSHADEHTAVYADTREARLTAVLNGSDGVEAGWGDHRAALVLRQTPQWQAWFAFCGKQRAQVEFAEFIEDHLADIFEPDGAHMLELAQSFEATTGVQFKSSQLLDSGERKLRYEETIDARASNGELTIPQRVVLGLQPYEGSNSYRVTARFRFRIINGCLTLGLILDDPRKVLETAYDEILVDVTAGLASEIPVLAGIAAASLHPGAQQ